MALRAITGKLFIHFSKRGSIQLIRNASTERLIDRTVLAVQRESCQDFLQGLITNDVSLLETSKCIFTTFLNSKGRILYDAFIYKTNSPDLVNIECGTQVANALSKYLRLYSLRTKIDVTESKLAVWAVFDSTENNKMVPDPRCKEMLPLRCLSEVQPENKLVEDMYISLRYSLGIIEGPLEISPGDGLPLEYNIDFLNGVSFDKGCYIGQELTARVHHTGVIRKRIMPLDFNEAPSKDCDFDAPVTDLESGKTVGKIRGVHGTRGLGLMRVKESVSSKGLNWNGLKVKVVIPAWWPSLITESSLLKRV